MNNPAAMASKQTDKVRQAYMVLIIGTNGTGKTTLANKLLSGIANRKVLVIDNEGMEEEWAKHPYQDLAELDGEEWNGIRQTWYIQHDEESWKYLFNHFQNGVIVFDDAATYIRERVAKGTHLGNLFVRRRQKQIDLVFISHSFQDIPPRVWDFLGHNCKIFLFKQASEPYFGRKKPAGHQKILEAYNRVMQKSQSNPHHYEMVEI